MEALLDGWQAPAGRPCVAIDPACGPGALLEALAHAWGPRGPLRLHGVELDPPVAAQARHKNVAQIHQGDALALAGQAPLLDESADLVVLNPPYLGEKGRAPLFEAAAALGPRWARRTVARMDYLYYFLHLALDLLRPGGRLVALTTAYWPAATGASALRQDLARRAALVQWVRFEGAPLFEGATGQHNLALVAQKLAPGEAAQTTASRGWISLHRSARGALRAGEPQQAAPLDPEGAPWNPFADAQASARAQAQAQRWGARLGELALDRQGVVSGCDRVTRRHLRLLGPGCGLREGAPGFLWTAGELAQRGWLEDEALRPWFRPLLRGSQVSRPQVLTRRAPLEDPETPLILYLRRGDEPPEALLEHLAPLRPVLERRREVEQGKLPWWALHWARDLEPMLAPKLVTARRGTTVAFCLDLAGHVVSSDCTFLSAPAGREGWLAPLWEALHLPQVEAQWRLLGRHKGAVMEFYSQPLRGLPLPLRPRGEALEHQSPPEALERLRRSLDPATLGALQAFARGSATRQGR